MGQLIIIAGPTASGKTSLSLDLAPRFKAEIISADARQFYRGMDIGTAKPTTAELARVPHHFIDILDPDQAYTAGAYEADVLSFLTSYFQSHDTAIMVGGSGLYIKAIMEGFDVLPPTPEDVRKRLNDVPLATLQHALSEKDPAYASEVDMANRQRVQRALEAIEVSGVPFSQLRKQSAQKRPFSMHGVLLSPPRELLYQRINERVDHMMDAGLVDEVKRLRSYRTCNALQTVGYKEVFQCLDGNWSLDHAVDKIKQHTRNYAKRQFTWFRKQNGFTTFENADVHAIERHLQKEMNV